jgi:predicted DNA-binding protein with PD1-like motif
MILTVSKKGRTFIGRLDHGDALLERLNSLAETNNIRTATFSAGGYVRDPEIAVYLPEVPGIGDKKRSEGAFFVSSLRGSISMRGTQREISIQAHLVGPDGESLTGFLTGATVVFLDLTLSSMEDIILVRELDPEIGVSQWMGVLLPEMLDPEPQAAPSRLGGARGSSASSVPSFLFDDEDIPEVFKGDFLEHPSLGKCKVVNVHEDDRVTVILPEQGKLAEINLEFFTYKIIRKESGRQYIRLDVRRR